MRISSVQLPTHLYHLCVKFDVIWRNAPQKTTFLLILWTLLFGCASQTEETVPVATNEPEATPAEPIPRVELLALLDAADRALARDHLTSPRAGSALAIYEQILARDPSQDDARRGIERIVEEYVALAMTALERRQFASARSMLARARLINPDHPSIEPSAEQIRLIQEAERKTLQLADEDLSRESAELKAALSQLSRDAQGKSCRFVIAASSDGQGRWIYEQLSDGSNGARLRAQITIRRPSSVERLCFET